MLLSLCIVFAAGLLLGGLFRRLKLPALLGMLLGGILAGPYCLNILDGTLLAISPELRKIALVIILAKAGLALDVKELAKVGRPALLLCFVPATMEILAFTLFAPALLGVSRVEAAMLGAVMGAVSPAVIVPRLTALIEEGWGTEKGIPQMLVAGASADDVYCVVVFYAMLSAAQGGGVSLSAFGKIPLSIAAGVLAGIGLGLLAAAVLRRWKNGLPAALVLLMALCFLLVEAERLLDGVFPLSGLIGVMTLGMTVHQRDKNTAKELAGGLSALWVPAEMLLFVLVGTLVDVRYALRAGGAVLLMIAVSLLFRSAGLALLLLGTPLNGKERLFCVFAELPKATVQAAIGGAALAAGLGCGQLVLTVSVTAILITAPVGAVLIDRTSHRWLRHEERGTPCNPHEEGGTGA